MFKRLTKVDKQFENIQRESRVECRYNETSSANRTIVVRACPMMNYLIDSICGELAISAEVLSWTVFDIAIHQLP